MSFFGLSSQGKNSRGQLENIPYILQDQMNNAFTRGGQQQQQGGGYTQQYADYLNSILNDPNGGFFNPQQINDYGNQAMPGVDAANTDRMARLGGLPSVQSGTDVTGSLNGINNARSDEFLRTLNGAFDPAISNNDQNYGYLRKIAGDTYGGLQSDTGKAYDAATQNVQRLLPTGDLAAAAAARSFAPAMAASQRRLRTAGIDPNSPEASGILQGVDVARGRSMDDTMAANQGNYINQLNSLLMGKNSDLANLKLGGLGAETNLTQAQTDIGRQLALTKANQQMQNTNQNAATQSGIVNQGRTMSVQDQALAQQLADQYNNANLQNIGLHNQRFNAGVSGLGLGLQQKNNAAGSLGQLGTTLTNQGQTSLNSGLQFGNQASQGFGQNLGIEQANSGWGTKLLAGLAGGALNAVAPGLTSGIMGASGLGGVPSYANQGGFGGYGTPPFQQQQQNPYGNLMGQIGSLFKSSPAPNYGFSYPNPSYGGYPGGTA